jgi:DNA alkylation damage repair protein AlkB
MMPESIQLAPGMFHLPHYLPLEEQAALATHCLELGRGAAGFYTPTVRGGAKMRLQMLCLGRHWNALTYKYEASRADFDGKPAPELPVAFATLAARIAAEAGFAFHPDVCIMNYYSEDGRLGVHQDKDERPETLAAGVPIVSVSLGDTARFVVGGTRRKDALQAVMLESGDAFVMGGPARLRYHGVTRVLSGSGPASLGLDGRINLTFRQY